MLESYSTQAERQGLPGEVVFLLSRQQGSFPEGSTPYLFFHETLYVLLAVKQRLCRC